MTDTEKLETIHRLELVYIEVCDLHKDHISGISSDGVHMQTDMFKKLFKNVNIKKAEWCGEFFEVHIEYNGIDFFTLF